MKRRWCVWVSVFLLAWLPATSKLVAEQGTKPKKVTVKPARNGVPVYTSARVLIGVLDKDAQVEVLVKTDQWCKVQYTKDGNRFVGWVLKEDLALPDTPPPKKKEDSQPKILSVEETSVQLRKIARVGVDYKSSRGQGWVPDRRVGYKWAKVGKVEMKLRLDGKGMPAKMIVLRYFQRDAAVELYVENKIVELKKFRRIADPAFDRVIQWYIRALEAYNEDRIADFRRLIESADNFWDFLDSNME